MGAVVSTLAVTSIKSLRSGWLNQSVQEGRVLRLGRGLGTQQDMAVVGKLTIVTAKSTGAKAGQQFLRMTYRGAGGAYAGLNKLAAPGSTLLKGWFAFVQKSIHAFYLVGRAEQRMEQVPFVAQAF